MANLPPLDSMADTTVRQKMKLPLWLGSLLTVLMIVAIACQPQLGFALPDSALFLFLIATFSSTFGGLRTGLTSASFIALYIAAAPWIGFDSLPFLVDPLSATLAIILLFIIVIFLGRQQDTQNDLTQALQQSYDDLKQQCDRQAAELSQTQTALQAEVEKHQQFGASMQASEQKLNAIFESALDAIAIADQAERKRQQERDFIAAVLNTVSALVIVLDCQGRIVRFNQTCEKVTGYSYEEVAGQCVWDLFLPPEEQYASRLIFDQILAGQPLQQHETSWICKNGNLRIAIWSNTVLFSEAGAAEYIVATGNDITEQRRAAAALKHQTQRTQLLAEVTLNIRRFLQLETILQTAVKEVQKILQADRVLIFQISPDGSGTVVQEAVLPDWPVVLGEWIDDPCFRETYLEEYRQGRVSAISDVKHANIQPCHINLLQQFAVQSNLIVPILSQDHLWGLLIAHQCDRPRRWNFNEIELLQQLADQIGIALSQAQLLDHLEEAVKERTAALTITNQQLQRQIRERRDVEAALRQSEEQIRLITNTLPVLIAYVDTQQYYRFVNQAYEVWFGCPIRTIQDRPIQALLGETAYQGIRPRIEAALAGQHITYEREVLHQDGSNRYVSITYIPHIGEQGNVKGLVSLMTDISDRKAVERMKDEFVSVVSHELRTPLTSIHGSLQLLATGRLGTLAERGQRMLDIAVSNTDRLVRLINDILDLERMESGKTSMAKQVCNTAALMNQAADLIQPLAKQEGITLSLHLLSLTVWADPDHILQTLTNLLSNAIKFSPPSNTVWLTVEQQSEEKALFCVKDRGRGIPTDKLETIFERFQQVDASDSRKKGGTGLGLAICRNIIQAHGGRIWAESTPGQGSCFYFTLKIVKQQAEKIDGSQTHPDR